MSYLTTPPSWITIDSNTGIISYIAPEVASDVEFDFYINSNINGVADSAQKLIKIKVIACFVTNCQKCSSTSNLIWETWISGY